MSLTRKSSIPHPAGNVGSIRDGFVRFKGLIQGQSIQNDRIVESPYETVDLKKIYEKRIIHKVRHDLLATNI